MMFITPTPPTSSAIDEMKIIASVIPPVICRKFPISLSGVMIPKSFGLLNGTFLRARRTAMPCSVMSSTWSARNGTVAMFTPRERLILRQRYIDQLNLDEVGALHGVHRITVMRWLARIEKTLLREIRRSLMARLRLAESEVEHLVDDARSRLDLSLRGLLDARSVLE